MPQPVHTFMTRLARFCVVKSLQRWGRPDPTGSAFPFPPRAAFAFTIRGMNGLMMDFPLTTSAIFRRAEQMFRRREIVWPPATRPPELWSVWGTPSASTRARDTTVAHVQ